jgi:hypothetical protein
MFWARSNAFRSANGQQRAGVVLSANEDEKRLAYYHGKKKFFSGG